MALGGNPAFALDGAMAMWAAAPAKGQRRHSAAPVVAVVQLYPSQRSCTIIINHQAVKVDGQQHLTQGGLFRCFRAW